MRFFKFNHIHRLIDFCDVELVRTRLNFSVYTPSGYRIHTRIRNQAQRRKLRPDILGLSSLAGRVKRLSLLHPGVRLNIHGLIDHRFKDFTQYEDLNDWDVPIVRKTGEAFC
jgi:hypothetical protein